MNAIQQLEDLGRQYGMAISILPTRDDLVVVAASDDQDEVDYWAGESKHLEHAISQVRRMLAEFRGKDLEESVELEPDLNPPVVQHALKGFGVPAWVSHRLKEVGYLTDEQVEYAARGGVAEQVFGPKVASLLHSAMQNSAAEDEYVWVEGCPLAIIKRNGRLYAPWSYSIKLEKDGCINRFESIDESKWVGWARSLVKKEAA